MSDFTTFLAALKDHAQKVSSSHSEGCSCNQCWYMRFMANKLTAKEQTDMLVANDD